MCRNKQASFLALAVVLLVAISLIYPEPLVVGIAISTFTFFLSGIFSTKNDNLRVVLAFAYVAVGFFAYLLIRGLVISTPVNSADLPLSITLIAALGFFAKFSISASDQFKFQPLGIGFIGGSAALISCIVFGAYLFTKGQGFLLAWAGSGDARNHIQWAYSVASEGGILTTHLLYPQLPTALSVMLSAGNSTDLLDDSSVRLKVDLTSLAVTWAVFIAFIGYAFAATWEEVLYKSKLSKINKSLLLVPISFSATSSLVLGTYMRDGFITALAGSLALAIAIAFILDKSILQSKENFLLAALVFSFAFFSYTLLAITISIFLMPRFFSWVKRAKSKRVLILKVIFTIGGLSLVPYVFRTFFEGTLRETLTLPGSITPIDQEFFFLCMVLLLVLALFATKSSIPRNRDIYLIFFS